jgi:hypothetical protein
VHHAAADDYHTSMFLQRFQEGMLHLETWMESKRDESALKDEASLLRSFETEGKMIEAIERSAPRFSEEALFVFMQQKHLAQRR